MLAGLSVAIALTAQVPGPAPVGVSAAPAAPATAAPADPGTAAQANSGQATAADRCPTLRNAQPGEIVVCGQRSQGYRLDPDVMEASRGMRGRRARRPERMRDTSCASVGPAGCMGAGGGVNLIGVALTAAQMAARLAKGQAIGSMFVTDPQRSEYQLYVEAKRAREADEAEAKAVAAAKAKAGPQARAVDAQAAPIPAQ